MIGELQASLNSLFIQDIAVLALATKGSLLIQETNQLLSNLRHYLPKDDFRLRRLMAEADKLMNANPQEAHNVKGMVYQLSGDFEQSL